MSRASLRRKKCYERKYGDSLFVDEMGTPTPWWPWNSARQWVGVWGSNNLFPSLGDARCACAREANFLFWSREEGLFLFSWETEWRRWQIDVARHGTFFHLPKAPPSFYCCCGVYTTPLGHKLSPFETERERLELLWEIMGPDLEVGKKRTNSKTSSKVTFFIDNNRAFAFQ